MIVLTVPDVLRERLGAEGAEALVGLLDQAAVQARGEIVSVAEERFGRRLAELEAHIERRLADEIGKVWQAIAALETRLTDRMAALETRVIRWMFAFWITQFGVLIGILFAFFKP